MSQQGQPDKAVNDGDDPQNGIEETVRTLKELENEELHRRVKVLTAELELAHAMNKATAASLTVARHEAKSFARKAAALHMRSAREAVLSDEELKRLTRLTRAVVATFELPRGCLHPALRDAMDEVEKEVLGDS